MMYHLRTFWFALLTCVVVGFTVSAATAGDQPPRPNWRGTATGTTRPEGTLDVDELSGRCSHLGRYTGEGFHDLNPLDFTFVGEATWTAANGDTLQVTYSGQVFLTGDPDYPFGFVADLEADGGSGRFSDATGRAVMTGAFTGVPGEFFLDFEGSLHPNGR